MDVEKRKFGWSQQSTRNQDAIYYSIYGNNFLFRVSVQVILLFIFDTLYCRTREQVRNLQNKCEKEQRPRWEEIREKGKKEKKKKKEGDVGFEYLRQVRSISIIFLKLICPRTCLIINFNGSFNTKEKMIFERKKERNYFLLWNDVKLVTSPVSFVKDQFEIWTNYKD